MPNTFNVWRGEQSGLHFAGFDRAKVRDGGFFFAFEKEAADGYARDGQSRNFLVSCARVLDLTSENLDVLQWVANWGNEFEWYDRYSGEPSDAYSFIASGSLFDYEGIGAQGAGALSFRQLNRKVTTVLLPMTH